MIVTARLELIPATQVLTQAALQGAASLAAQLSAVVPSTWPPEYLDTAALEYTLARLDESVGHADWWLYFVLLPMGAGSRTLIGSAGYKGPPAMDGTVELGYGIVRDYRRLGYATEATLGLLAHAFSVSAVRRVIAETLPELTGSIGVLHKCGFRLLGTGSEPGVIRFERTRADHDADGGGCRGPRV